MITIFRAKELLSVLAVFFLVLLFTAGCGSPDTAPVAGEADQTMLQEEAAGEEAAEEMLFTMDEIARFDGKEGRPAYIVVDGVVYDVSNVGPWSSGTHYGFNAGIDATEALRNSAPHGANLLNQAEIVGRLAD